MLKLYCYTDETGQDTKGKFFLVFILLTEKDNLEELRENIGKIEKETRRTAKWTHTKNKEKILFIESILKLKILQGKLYFSAYNNSNAYIPLVAMAIGKAIIHKTKDCEDEYKTQIIIDDLRESDREIIRKELKQLNIKFDKIKINLKDEQDELLRLVDALAGFTRDYLENKKYAVQLMKRLNFRKFFIEI